MAGTIKSETLTGPLSSVVLLRPATTLPLCKALYEPDSRHKGKKEKKCRTSLSSSLAFDAVRYVESKLGVSSPVWHFRACRSSRQCVYLRESSNVCVVFVVCVCVCECVSVCVRVDIRMRTSFPLM